MKNALTDRERIQYLRSVARNIGHTDGTSFDEATVTIYNIRPGSSNIISMKEVREMMDFYNVLPSLVELGHKITPPESFAYWILKDTGLINAFSALAEFENKIDADPEVLIEARKRWSNHTD